MKIYSLAAYFNEQLIGKIKYETEKSWVDEIHFVESNYNFRKAKKEYNFDETGFDQNILKYHKLDCKHKFVSMNIAGKMLLAPKRLSNNFYNKIVCHPQWYNESVTHNILTEFIKPEDDDIIILSDIDEIIDPKYKDDLIKKTLEKGIITIKMHFTMFYFNLFSQNWTGPEGYSYRLFMMTGKYFKENKIKYDYLRKCGENGKLLDRVYCYPEYAGFHHSWVGDENFILNKIHSYSHIEEHANKDNIEYVKHQLKNGLSLFPGHELKVNNDIKLLSYIEDNKRELKQFFI